MRTIVFFDGQHLFRTARTSGARDIHTAGPATTWNSWPSACCPCHQDGFYRRSGSTPVFTEKTQDYPRHWFWTNKLNYLEAHGVYVYRGRVRGGIGDAKQEKGVDVSLAIDLVQATHEQRYEVAIIVSKDSDFGPGFNSASR